MFDRRSWRVAPAVTSLIALTIQACGSPGEALPTELTQVWQTAAPAYQDRYIELREGLLIFGTGGTGISVHQVERVESNPGASGSVTYALDYRDDERQILHIELIYSPGPEPTLRMANRQEIWTPMPQTPGDS